MHKSFNPNALRVSFGGQVAHGFGFDPIVLVDPPKTETVRIVLKRRSRKKRQKFLMEESRRQGVPIRVLKRHWGNGSVYTIPGCVISSTVDSMGGRTWNFRGSGHSGTAVIKATGNTAP